MKLRLKYETCGGACGDLEAVVRRFDRYANSHPYSQAAKARNRLRWAQQKAAPANRDKAESRAIDSLHHAISEWMSRFEAEPELEYWGSFEWLNGKVDTLGLTWIVEADQ